MAVCRSSIGHLLHVVVVSSLLVLTTQAQETTAATSSVDVSNLVSAISAVGSLEQTTAADTQPTTAPSSTVNVDPLLTAISVIANSDVTTAATTAGTDAPDTSAQTTAAKPTDSEASLQLTIVSDSESTGTYGISVLPQYTGLTSQTFETATFVISEGTSPPETTTAAVFVAVGGRIAFPTPVPIDGIIPKIKIDDIIGKLTSGLKCPAFLKWLCGPSNTGDKDNGDDVDPKTKPDGNKNDDDGPPDPENTSTQGTSECSTKTTAPSCAIKLGYGTNSQGSTTATSTITTSCQTITACSATPFTTTISTDSVVNIPKYTAPSMIMDPFPAVDQAVLDKDASSIDASLKSFYSSLWATTLATTAATTGGDTTAAGEETTAGGTTDPAETTDPPPATTADPQVSCVTSTETHTSFVEGVACANNPNLPACTRTSLSEVTSCSTASAVLATTQVPQPPTANVT